MAAQAGDHGDFGILIRPGRDADEKTRKCAPARMDRHLSNVARFLHWELETAVAAFDDGDEYSARQMCLKLLTDPFLPRYTRIETLHLLAVVTNNEAHTRRHIARASEVIAECMAEQEKPTVYLKNLRFINDALLKQQIAHEAAGKAAGVAYDQSELFEEVWDPELAAEAEDENGAAEEDGHDPEDCSAESEDTD